MSGTGREFTCDNCGGIFISSRSDEEANEEAKEIFGEVPEDPAKICHPCWLELMRWLGFLKGGQR